MKTFEYYFKFQQFFVRMTILLLIFSLSGRIFAQNPLIEKDDYVARANYEFNAERWDAGKELVDIGLKESPEDSDLRLLAGKFYFHKKMYDKARYELKKALEYNPDNYDAKHILVNVETESKRYSSAICYINELLEINPYDKGLWRKMIKLYTLQGNKIETNRLIERINLIYPQDSSLLYDYLYETELTAIAKQKSGDIEEAINLRHTLIKNNPYDASNYIALANNYLKAGKSEEALAQLDKGLYYIPEERSIIYLKSSILSDLKRYSELLDFLHQEAKKSGSTALMNQYNYYLSEAARHAKDSEPFTLYGKIFNRSPEDKEAFNYLFAFYMRNHLYEEALYTLRKHQRFHPDSKELAFKELSVFSKMGNKGQTIRLTRNLLLQYPEDSDLKANYLKMLYEEARQKMQEELYPQAIDKLTEIVKLADETDRDILFAAQISLYNTYYATGDYVQAMNLLNDIISNYPNEPAYYLKKAELCKRINRYKDAFNAYEQALEKINKDDKKRYLEGYSEFAIPIIKELDENFRYEEAMLLIERWLTIDPSNYQALVYAVNLSHKMKKRSDMHAYAQTGITYYPDDVFFKIKIAETKEKDKNGDASLFYQLQQEVKLYPYHEQLVNVYAQAGENYALQLIKEKKAEKSLAVLDSVLIYAPNNKSLKYTKGIAFEKLNKFDSAYLYQSFYEPSLLEYKDFSKQLNLLAYKGHRNEIGVSYIHNRLGDNYAISTMSSLAYSRITPKNTYTGRINYTGRDSAKGFQLQAEWNHTWNKLTHSRIDLAWANKFFPAWVANASLYRDVKILGGIEAEIGLGARLFHKQKDLFNLLLGASKDLDRFRLNLKLNNFLLGRKWLYNISGQATYYMDIPKNFLLAMANVGTSPDVDIIDYQLYSGFSTVNMMVGFGAGRLVSKTVAISIIGNWYNYLIQKDTYKNFYNINVNVHIVF